MKAHCLDCSWGATDDGIAVIPCQLHAAAPAMLAALEAVEREFQYHEGPSWLAAARAAIREARGEAQP